MTPLNSIVQSSPRNKDMPTAARLIAALSLAVLAFVISGMIVPLMPDDTDFKYFSIINMALALVVGWRFVGVTAGRGIVSAITDGLTGTMLLVILALILQGSAEMFDKAHQFLYDDPFEALAAIFVIALDYFFIICVPNILAALAIGGIIVGLATEFASRRWP